MKSIWLWGVLALGLAGCSTSAREAAGTHGGIAIAVTERGFEPPEVKVAGGAPVTLAFTRRTDATCAKEVVIADYGIRKELPLDQRVEVTFTPRGPGAIGFACGMNMITGRLIVE